MRYHNHRIGFAASMDAADLLWSALHLQGVADDVISGRSSEFSLIEAVEALADSLPVLQRVHLYPGVAEA